MMNFVSYTESRKFVQWIMGMMIQEAPKILPIVVYSSSHF